jgi:hypothetical protein
MALNNVGKRLALCIDLAASGAVERVPIAEEGRGDAVLVVEVDRTLENLIREDVALGEVLGDD